MASLTALGQRILMLIPRLRLRTASFYFKSTAVEGIFTMPVGSTSNIYPLETHQRTTYALPLLSNASTKSLQPPMPDLFP
ncbi:uncharacterized protein EAF01_008418 [Botrytis porri]|uniref:uncharacterized protein n=1 Tax=Botrytis porri TaxID=87229 RepID=UPI001902B8B9|nr:uncharacterized protein EAF01_008418 [Botrytis porri]KAF7899205.1 hypothetical protein EAF01_008418 [Botrytis porri]